MFKTWEAEVFSWNRGGTPKNIFISQRKYVLDLLEEPGFLGGKVASLPVEQTSKLVRIRIANQLTKGRYQKLVGLLIYHTRIDIAFAMSLISQFMHNPTFGRRILNYLESKPGKGILFSSGNGLTLKVLPMLIMRVSL